MAKKGKKGKNTIRYFDYSLVAIIVFLMCFGLVMLYSSSSYEGLTEWGDSMYFFKRQAIISAVGLVITLVVSRIDYHRYAKWSTTLFLIAMFLMGLVKFSPLGITRNQSRRWLWAPVIGQFQPSEVMKIAIIVFIPYLICKIGDKIHSRKGILAILVWGFVAFYGVFRWTDNLSTAVIVLGIVCVMLFVIDRRTKLYIGIGACSLTVFVGMAVVLGRVLENSTNFRLRRIIAWLHPEKYASGLAFQTVQGLYAIGSGGFFGKGLGNSAQKMVIPEVQNDMILTVICEELGVFGALIVLTLFGLLLYRLIFIAQNAPDRYGALIVTGIFAHIALQVVLNVAVVTNMIPNTGITLPFISYGGTSIMFLMAEMGIALGVSNRIRLEE